MYYHYYHNRHFLVVSITIIITITISIIKIIFYLFYVCSVFSISFATWIPVNRLSLIKSDYHDILTHDRSQCCCYWTFFNWEFIKVRLIFNFLKLFALKSAVLSLIGDICFSKFYFIGLYHE